MLRVDNSGLLPSDQTKITCKDKICGVPTVELMTEVDRRRMVTVKKVMWKSDGRREKWIVSAEKVQ